MSIVHPGPCLAFIAVSTCYWLMSSVATGTFCAELISGESGHVSQHGVAPSMIQDVTFVCPELQKVFFPHCSFFHTAKVPESAGLFSTSYHFVKFGVLNNLLKMQIPRPIAFLPAAWQWVCITAGLLLASVPVYGHPQKTWYVWAWA